MKEVDDVCIGNSPFATIPHMPPTYSFGRMGRRFLLLMLCLGLLGLVSAASAALMISQGSLSGSTPVRVEEIDDTIVRGTINQCTPELLYVMPAPKMRNGVAQAPATQPTEIPWAKIRGVSNGLNARLAMDMWLAAHKDKLCPTCHGERTIWCPVCKGTRHDPKFAATCPTCLGKLQLICRTIGEKNGQIPCPNSCLKLGVGNWSKNADGLRIRTWTFAGGSQWYSEHHLGDVMFLDPKAMPPVSDQGVCPICGGTTLVNDPKCFGSGFIPCPTCVARASAGPCPNHCINGRVVCPTCGGTGLANN